ncbi:uridine-cytidine kinase-like 1 isoform X2 [Opisthocomus hoazin]|uniref:uridine-cytidine kinase-like 1 isoform X2 n=1 Tax=Opisthocomus hoazin TaxID=30419 RepID=UPI003F5329A6
MAAAPLAEGAPAEPHDSNSSAESLDRLYPAVGSTKPPRKRTTSQCKSEPPLLRTSKRTIYTAGRPPWYNEHGTQSKEAFVIGLGGGSASGKTTVATMIIEALDVPWVVLLSMDSFYKVLTKQQQEQAASNDFNFDHPDAFDFDLIIATLKKLKQGKSVKIPIYDFTTHSRKKEWKTLYGANVIIFEGIMAFADKELLKLLDLKIFVDTDSDIRLVRRLRRDISERGRDIEGVIKQYNKFVKPAFDQYIQPTMRLADIVVPRGSGNTVAIDLIVQHVHSQLEEVRAARSPGADAGVSRACAAVALREAVLWVPRWEQPGFQAWEPRGCAHQLLPALLPPFIPMLWLARGSSASSLPSLGEQIIWGQTRSGDRGDVPSLPAALPGPALPQTLQHLSSPASPLHPPPAAAAQCFRSPLFHFCVGCSPWVSKTKVPSCFDTQSEPRSRQMLHHFPVTGSNESSSVCPGPVPTSGASRGPFHQRAQLGVALP